MQNIIPGFDRFEQIGEGLFAVVWKAHQISLDRMVAIKIVKPQFTSKPDEVSAFIQEARAAAKLKHPNIVQVYDVAEQEGIYYFVMEYVAGATVAKTLQSEGPMSEKRAMKIVSDVADALEEAWDKGSLVHRNISPRNIMVDADGSVKLSDLGLAKLADFLSISDEASKAQFRGLYNYISPEQSLRTRLDCRSDMYSLGACLYHMVTGEMPFEIYTPSQIMQSITKETIPSPRDIKPSLSQGIVRLITRLMMKDPKNRYRNWKEAVKDIKKVAAGHSIAAPQIPGAVSTVDSGSGRPSMGGTQPMPNIRVQAPVQVRIQPAASAKSQEEVYERYNEVQKAAGSRNWLRAPFWIVMVLFWAYLCVILLTLPPVESELPKPIDAMILDDTAKPVKELKPVTTTSEKPAKPGTDTPSTTGQPPTGYQPGIEPKPDDTKKPDEKAPEKKPTQTTEKPTEQPPASTGATDKDLLKGIADNLMAEKFDKATALVKKAHEATNVEASVKTELETLKKYVAEVSRLNSAVEAALVDNIGGELTLKVGGVSRKVTIRAMIGNNLNVEYLVNNVPQTATVTVSGLDPAEKAKLLGKATSQSKNAMKFILFMKAKDYESAKEVVEKCGPLSDLFKSELESKSQ